jgi:hypothetical protein
MSKTLEMLMAEAREKALEPKGRAWTEEEVRQLSSYFHTDDQRLRSDVQPVMSKIEEDETVTVKGISFSQFRWLLTMASLHCTGSIKEQELELQKELKKSAWSEDTEYSRIDNFTATLDMKLILNNLSTDLGNALDVFNKACTEERREARQLTERVHINRKKFRQRGV